MDTNEKFYFDLGNKICQEREKLYYLRHDGRMIITPNGTPMSQEAFVEYMDQEGKHICNRAQLSRIENGSIKAINSLGIEQWMNLCHVFRCDLAYLIGDQDFKEQTTQSIHDLTGLSEAAINKLGDIHSQETLDKETGLNPIGFSEAISTLIEDENYLNLMNLLIMRYSVDSFEDLNLKRSYKGQDIRPLMEKIPTLQSKVTFPGDQIAYVYIADMLESRITHNLISMISRMRTAFTQQLPDPDQLNLKDNSAYINLSYDLGYRAISNISQGKLKVNVDGSFKPITDPQEVINTIGSTEKGIVICPDKEGKGSVIRDLRIPDYQIHINTDIEDIDH